MFDARFSHSGFAEERFRFILAEDGNEVCFERSAVGSNGVGEDDLKVGHYVEFELQYGFEQPCVVNVKRLRSDRG